MNGYITVIEAAKRLGVTDGRVRQLILDGTLPAQKVGNVILVIPTTEVARLKRERTRKTNRKAA